jgi:hypothetical protein
MKDMLKKIVLLAVVAFSLVSTIGAASYPQYPVPSCYPCGGGGN